MTLAILISLFFAAVGIAMIVSPEELSGRQRIVGAIGCFVVAGISFGSGCYATVDEGHDGIVITFGKASDVPMEPGLNLKLPWQSVKELSWMNERFEETFLCSSKDLQHVTVKMVVVWQRQKYHGPEIWRQVGADSAVVHVAPMAREVLKATISKYDATAIVQNRSTVSSAVESDIRLALEKFSLQMIETSLADIEFTPNFQRAIEAKQNALEDARKAVNELEEAITRAKITKADATGEADAAIQDSIGAAAAAQKKADATVFETLRLAEAEVKSIEVDGIAEASRILALGESLNENPGVIQIEAIERWEAGGGNVPTYLLNADGVTPEFLLETPKLKHEE